MAAKNLQAEVYVMKELARLIISVSKQILNNIMFRKPKRQIVQRQTGK